MMSTNTCNRQGDERKKQQKKSTTSELKDLEALANKLVPLMTDKLQREMQEGRKTIQEIHPRVKMVILVLGTKRLPQSTFTVL